MVAPTRRAASSVTRYSASSPECSGLVSSAIFVAPGTSSLRTSTRLADSSSAMNVIPVMLSPGRARLFAKPDSTGSPLYAKTTGTLARIAFAKSVTGGRPRGPLGARRIGPRR